MKLLTIAALFFISEVASFKITRSSITSKGSVCGSSLTNKGKFTSSTQLHMDATLIPLLIGATGLIFAGSLLFSLPDIDLPSIFEPTSQSRHNFASLFPFLHINPPVFNFDNKIDLTDSGMAKAKALRYNARKERGEIPSKEAVANLDPYRWYVNDHLHFFFI